MTHFYRRYYLISMVLWAIMPSITIGRSSKEELEKLSHEQLVQLVHTLMQLKLEQPAPVPAAPEHSQPPFNAKIACAQFILSALKNLAAIMIAHNPHVTIQRVTTIIQDFLTLIVNYHQHHVLRVIDAEHAALEVLAEQVMRHVLQLIDTFEEVPDEYTAPYHTALSSIINEPTANTPDQNG